MKEKQFEVYINEYEKVTVIAFLQNDIPIIKNVVYGSDDLPLLFNELDNYTQKIITFRTEEYFNHLKTI